jgi:citronellol/citronellal dehydrogenase
VIDLNLNAVFTTISACQSALAVRGGSIVNISLSWVRGSVGIGHSLAARAGVLALTRTIALESAHLGIRANCIGPGAVLTNDFPAEVTTEMAEYLIPVAVPSGSGTPVEDIAEAVSFLASLAGRMISGQMLQVDGVPHLGSGLHMLHSYPPGIS